MLQRIHASVGETNVDMDGMTSVKYVNTSLSSLELAEFLTMQPALIDLQPILNDHRWKEDSWVLWAMCWFSETWKGIYSLLAGEQFRHVVMET